MRKRVKKVLFNKYIIIPILIIGLFIIIVFMCYMPKKLKNFYDITTKNVFDIFPKDQLLLEYDEYNAFIKEKLLKDEYTLVSNKNYITKESFINNDYLALFYEARVCSENESYPYEIQESKDKVIISVTRKESSSCEQSTHILFVSLTKNKYENMPNVVVKKQIIKK